MDTPHPAHTAAYPVTTPSPPGFAPQKPQSDLADVLQRVLDTGVVLVGDVGLVINGTEVLSLRVRLLVASIDKSEEIGLDWWRREPAFSSLAEKRRAGERRRIRKPPSRPARSLQGPTEPTGKETPDGTSGSAARRA
jgi:hypothetical protein